MMSAKNFFISLNPIPKLNKKRLAFIKRMMSLIRELAIGSYNLPLSYAMQPKMAGELKAGKKRVGLLAISMAFLLPEVSPPATYPPRQPDRMGREPQPPRTKKWSLRNDEGRQGEGTPERFSSLFYSRSGAEATTMKVAGWPAGGGYMEDAAWMHCCFVCLH